MTKRYLLQAAARNLGLLMRKLFGMGTPRGLQKEGKDSALVQLAHLMLDMTENVRGAVWRLTAAVPRRVAPATPLPALAA